MADYLTITDSRIPMDLKGELYLIKTVMRLPKLFLVLVHNLYYLKLYPYRAFILKRYHRIALPDSAADANA